MNISLWLNNTSLVAIELYAVAIEVLTARLSEQLLNIVAASQVGTLVVKVDHVRIPVGSILLGKERSVRGHAHDVCITLNMQQIEALSQCVDQFLVLGSILTQINLGLTVTRIFVVLTIVQEVSVRLVVVLVDNGHT